MQKILTADLPGDWDSVEIYPLSDLHVGDEYMDEKLFRKFIKHILEKW